MSHRVHTILSTLAEDHAPAALRPSILFAIDWPTVAEEAPATGDDAIAATLVALRLRGAITDNHPAIAPLAARLATMAASLATTGDKAMAIHATALWGAAAALVGMPTGIDSGLRASVAALAIKAADIIPGVIAAGPAERATLIATALDRVAHWIQTARAQHAALCDLGWDGDANLQVWAAARKREHDKALADIHALRDILGEAEGATIVLDLVRKALGWEMGEGPLSDFAAAVRKRADEANAARVTLANVQSLLDKTERCREALRTERDHLRAQVDRMIAAMREDAPAPVKTRPQPGDVVSWAEVEDGALYFSRDNQGAKFHAHSGGHWYWLYGADDSSLERLLRGVGCIGTTGYEGTLSTLVARDLGTNPEAWRKAMREWTASELTRPR